MSSRPQLRPISKECAYEGLSRSIGIDLYFPSNPNIPCPIALVIPGGGCVNTNRRDISVPLVEQLLSHGFVVASMGYSVIPEATSEKQQEDVCSVEPWLREILPTIFPVNGNKIVVVGPSVGGLLALWTRHLWQKPPDALLVLYPPTNMHNLPFLASSRFSKLPQPPQTPELLASATNFEDPPTQTPLPITLDDYNVPRQQMGRQMFEKGLFVEVLLRGVQNDNGILSWPQKGCVTADEINQISPMQMLREDSPKTPVCLIAGDKDDIFDVSHTYEYHKALERFAIPSKAIIVQDRGHAFDIYEDTGSEIEKTVFAPAIEWIMRFVMETTAVKSIV